MPTNNPLPPRENNWFKRILKCYEQKQYKNGLKFAKQILSNPKFQEHGETLAMKGLTLNCLGRKEEAYDHVRRGLRNDLRSHVCWHVYGLLQRSDRKYDEAIKCYRNALKWDNDNLQILRDLSLLQIQMRDLDGYRETRYRLLVLRPGQRASWIGYAMAYHLLKNYEMSLQILREFEKTQQVKPFDYEHSELILYHAQILRESGQLQHAMDFLDKNASVIVDKLAVAETKVEILLQLERRGEALAILWDLLDRNQENKKYYTLLEEAIQPDSELSRVSIYDKAHEKYPRALLPVTLPLHFLTGDSFRVRVDAYIKKALRKGIPPLFVQLRGLYVSDEKRRVIGELMENHLKSLEAGDRFYGETEGGLEAPTVYLWCLYFLAQHYDLQGDTPRALALVDAAIEHTPTLIELYVVKARILKHAGDIFEAVKCLDEAQSLDTADRYINSKCAKYMLRANMITDAVEMCRKFTREGVDAAENLNEMQCMWFQTESANAYFRLGDYGEALKKSHEVDRHFTEIIEDQFDFHTYCMRKMTLQSYIGLLRLEDILHSHPFYFKVARCAIQMYLHLHDNPLGALKDGKNENTENLSAAEVKKMRNKQRKAAKKEQQKKAAKEEEEKKKEANKPKTENEPDVPRLETLEPEKLARPTDALEMACHFLRPLQTFAAGEIETHLLAFEVFVRRDKILLMLQSIKRAHDLDPHHPVLHFQKSLFVRKYLAGCSVQPYAEPVAKVLNHQIEKIFGTNDVEKMDLNGLNDQYLQTHGSTLAHRLAVAKVQFLLDNSKHKEAIALCTDLSQCERVTIKDAEEVIRTMKTSGLGLPSANSASIDAFRGICHERFPYAVVFFPPNTYTGPQATPPWAPEALNGAATKECFDHDDIENNSVLSSKAISDHQMPNGEVEISPGVPSSSCKPMEVENKKIDVDSLNVADVRLDVES